MALRPELVYSKERPLFVLGLIYSSFVWLAVALTLVGLFYVGVIFLAILFAHALWLAYVRGTAVKVSEVQFPHIHERAKAAAEKLGLPRTPDVYIMQHGGLMNAFATKLLSRHYVILLSDLVDGCHDQRQLDFIIGHEMTHLAAGHLSWNFVLAPFRLLPWVGPAYSRACEYTCDRGGHFVAGDLEHSKRALVVLAAGGKLAQTANLDAYMAQAQEAGHFWAAIHELVSSHPFLTKRVAALQAFAQPGSVTLPGRNFFAWLMAPFLGAGAGGAASAVIAVFILWFGVGAAVAIPMVLSYRQKQADLFAKYDLDKGGADAFGNLEASDEAPLGSSEAQTEFERELQRSLEAELATGEVTGSEGDDELARLRREFEELDREATASEETAREATSREATSKRVASTQTHGTTKATKSTKPSKVRPAAATTKGSAPSRRTSSSTTPTRRKIGVD